MDLFKKQKLKSIYVFNDYIYEFDINYGNNYIAINTDDEVFVCGRNMSGGLGLGNKTKVSEPLLNPDLSNKYLETFFRGHNCMFAKNDQDEIYCWGDNEKGELGLCGNQLCKDVKPVKNEFLSNKLIIEIYCGREESVALDKNGLVYFWTHFDKETVNQEVKLLEFTGQEKIRMPNCGLNHFLALSEGNTLFGWGRNNYGQLGTDTTRFIREPTVIEHKGIEIVQICCGGLSSYYLSSDKCVYFCGKCLTEEENCINCFTKIDSMPIIELISVKPYYYVLARSEENVYELGKFEFQFTRTSYLDYDNYLSDKFQITNGTLDYMKYSDHQKRTNITALDALRMFPGDLKMKIKLCYVFDDDFGKNIFYVTNEDEVFVTGSNKHCILGDGTDETLTKQYKIDELSHIGVELFFNGIYCMFAKTNTDQIYCWGKNAFGILGLGFVNDHGEYFNAQSKSLPDRELYRHFPHLKPNLNPYLSGRGIIEFYCYEYENFGLASSGELYGWGLNQLWDITEKIGSIVSTPALIKFEQDNHIIKFSAGLNHFMALDDKGDLFGWGTNHWMQLSSEKNFSHNKIEHVHSNVKDVICLGNNSYIITNDELLVILGQNLRYLKLSRFQLNFESRIAMLKLNPLKELVLCTETAVFEQIHRGLYKKTFYKSYENYLTNKFSSSFNELCHLSKRIQFENLFDFNLKELFETDNQKSPVSESLKMLDNLPEQSPKVFFKYDIKFNTYDIQELIGVGSYGKVYKIKDHLSDRIFALKCIPIKDKLEEYDHIFNEIEILSKIQSEYIVQYYTSNVSGNYLNIKMEYCESWGLNSLRDLIITKNNIFKFDNELLSAIDLYISIEIFKEIMEALNFLHTLDPIIIHGDLKPNNVFLKRSNDRFIKLGDFGLSSVDKTKFHLNIDDLNKIYLAPEILTGGKYSVYSDLYCLGLIVDELNLNKTSLHKEILVKLKDPEPNNRLITEEVLSVLQDNDSKLKQEELMKDVDWEFIGGKITSNFLIEFLRCKLKLPENSNLSGVQGLNDSSDILSRKFNQVREIGCGHFSKVFKVTDNLDEQEYAVKKINKKVISFDDENDLKREIEILSKLRDEKLVQYRNCWIDNNHAYIQMEICHFNMTNILENKRIYFSRIDEIADNIDYINLYELSICCEIFEKITRSLKFLHEFDIIHRDLKPENILIKIGKEVVFKIGDFGISKFYNNDEKIATNKIGSVKYVAPEVDNGVKYNLKADIYSLGKILLEILDVPIENDIPDDMTFGDETTNGYQNDVIKLIEDMTNQKEFNLRPDCSEILDRLKLFKLNWDRIRKMKIEAQNEIESINPSQFELNDILIMILNKTDASNQMAYENLESKSKHGPNRKPIDTKNTIERYINEYDELELVRTGGFGFIFKTKHRHDKHIYAIKKYYLGSMAINNRENRLAELKRFAKLDNIHIAQYKVSWLEKNIIYNQMEFCELFFGEILIRKLEIFQRNNTQPMGVTEYFVFYELFREWVKALDFLHSQSPPLTSGKLNQPLISLNHPHQFLRLVDIQPRQSLEVLHSAAYHDLKDIGQLLRNAPYIFDFDFKSKESQSIKSSDILRSKHDKIRDLIFYERGPLNIVDNSSFMKMIALQSQIKMNKRGDEQTYDDLVKFEANSEMTLNTSELDTKSILFALDQLKVTEKQLRESPDFPIIVYHLNVNEEIVYKIFEGKFRYRFNSHL